MWMNMEIWLSLFIVVTKIANIEAYFRVIIRSAYIFPGATLREIHEPIPGKDCAKLCDEVACGYLALIPQDWSKFQELGKIAGMSFSRRLDMIELKHCILFNLRSEGGKVATSGYLSEGVQMVLDGKLVTGRWLLASRIWEREHGFDAKDFAPPAFFDTFTFTDKDLQREVYSAAPPTNCPARRSALSSHAPSTIKDSSTEEDFMTTDESDEDSEEESPIVEEQTDEAEETTEGVFEPTTEGKDETEKSEETSRVVIDDDETTAAPATTETEEETDFEVELTTHDAEPTTEDLSSNTPVKTDDSTTARSTKTDDAETTTEAADDSEERQDTSPFAIDEQGTTPLPTTTSLVEETTDVVETSTGTDLDGAETTEEPSVQGDGATTAGTTTEGYPVKVQYSFWCGANIINSFDNSCSTHQALQLTENAFAPYVTANLAKCQMIGVRAQAYLRTLVQVADKDAQAWCAVTPCGGMNVPLAYERSTSQTPASGSFLYQHQTSLTSPLLCYVYSSASKV